MKGYHNDIEQQTTGNNDFRRVLYTGRKLQLVLMSLPPGCDIGAEVPEDRDQFFRYEQGRGQVDIDDNIYDVRDGSGVIVPAGARHAARPCHRNAAGRRQTGRVRSPRRHLAGWAHDCLRGKPW